MNKELDYYYKILGLQRGATRAEIKSAYRRLVKLFHPDRDQSPDTEEMYKEIQEAYKTLLERPFTGKSNTFTKTDHKTSKRAAWNPNSTDMEPEYDIGNKGTIFEEMLTLKLLLVILGSVPLLAIEGIGYIIIGVVLIIAAYFLSCSLKVNGSYEDNTAARMSFWLPLTISVGLVFFENSLPLLSYFFLIIVCFLGIFMPVEFLMKDPRYPSQW